jgi:UDP:flavonoid glycosyltransferase YjiC (YdhE family)
LTIAPHRILFATVGSLGDLHPCLALAVELKRRGHHVTVATTGCYRTKVERLGLAFHAIRPEMDPADPALIKQCEDLKTGFEVLFRKIILPHLEDTYKDLLKAARDADLMIAGEANFAAPLVAEKLGLRWVSASLSPISFLSARDPSLLVNEPWLLQLRRLGWPVYRAGLQLGRLTMLHWWGPIRKLRRQEGLRWDCDPLFRDKFSPYLVLAMFARRLAKPQRDWPPQTLQPGFVFFAENTEIIPELAAFFDAGEAPIVFTQGSTAVHNPGDFYRVSVEVAQRLGRRALLLGARAHAGFNSQDILSLPYAPYAQIFSRASVVVHQGGSGTTGEAMRAGRPMLIVPYGWDQPDNARRVERLGLGLHVPRGRYSVDTAAGALDRLLNDPTFAIRAAQTARQIRAEDGLAAACDAIEAVLPVSVTRR